MDPRSSPPPGCRSARRSASEGVSPSSQPERLSGRGLAPLSSWRATLSPSSSNIARSSPGSTPSVVRKLPIITPLRPALTASGCELVEVLDAPAAEPEQGVGEDEAEDRDPLDDVPGVHQLAVAELRPGARVEQVDRDRRRVDLGELERHLDALARRLAEVEDPADAALEARVLDRVDRADPALVADRRRDLVVVAARGLDVVVDALDARVGQLLGAGGGDVADRDAALEVRLLGDEAARPRGSSRSRASTAPGPG